MKMTSKLITGAIAIAGLACSCAAQESTAALDACTGAADAPTALAKCTDVIEEKTNPARDRAVAYVRRASAYQGSGNAAEAMADSNAAVELAPDSSMALANRGAIYSMQGNPDFAVRDLDAAIRLDPNNTLALGNRAILYGKAGEWEKSGSLMDRVLELNPESAQAWGERCWIGAAGSSDPAGAIPACNKAIELRDEPNNYNSRGMAYYRAGRYAEAIADYDHSIEGDPNSGSSFYIRGLAKKASGIEGAQADLDKGLQLEPGLRERYIRVGILPAQ